MNLITKLAYNALTKTIQAIAPGGVSIALASALGRTDGVAVPAGYIGETIESATITTTSIGTSETDITNASVTLSSGIWMVNFAAAVALVTGSTAGNESNVVLILTDAANTRIGGCDSQYNLKNPASASFFGGVTLSNSVVVRISTSVTYKLRAARNDFSGTGSASVYNSTDRRSKLYAIRIA